MLIVDYSEACRCSTDNAGLRIYRDPLSHSPSVTLDLIAGFWNWCSSIARLLLPVRFSLLVLSLKLQWGARDRWWWTNSPSNWYISPARRRRDNKATVAPAWWIVYLAYTIYVASVILVCICMLTLYSRTRRVISFEPRPLLHVALSFPSKNNVRRLVFNHVGE